MNCMVLSVHPFATTMISVSDRFVCSIRLMMHGLSRSSHLLYVGITIENRMFRRFVLNLYVAAGLKFLRVKKNSAR